MTSRVPLLHGSNELLGVPWRSFTFDEQVEGTKGTQKTSLFVKSVFWSNPGAYAVMATDLVSLWMENVPKDTLKERFDSGYLWSFQPPARENITNKLGQRMEKQHEDTTYHLKRTHSSLVIDVAFPQGAVNIKWSFNLQTIPALLGDSQGIDSTFAQREFRKHVVVPLIVLGDEYRRRTKVLVDLLKRHEFDVGELMEKLKDENYKRISPVFKDDTFYTDATQSFLDGTRTVDEMAKSLLGAPDQLAPRTERKSVDGRQSKWWPPYNKKVPDLFERETPYDSQLTPSQVERAMSREPSPRRPEARDRSPSVPLTKKARKDMNEEEEQAYLAMREDERRAEKLSAQEREKKLKDKEKARKFR